MDKTYLKMKVLIELIASVATGYVALTWPFSSLMINIILIVVCLFILMQALGNIDILNGYNKSSIENDIKNDDDEKLPLDSQQLDDNTQLNTGILENTTSNTGFLENEENDSFIQFIPDIIPLDDTDDGNISPPPYHKKNIDDGVDENNTFQTNVDYPEIPE